MISSDTPATAITVCMFLVSFKLITITVVVTAVFHGSLLLRIDCLFKLLGLRLNLRFLLLLTLSHILTLLLDHLSCVFIQINIHISLESKRLIAIWDKCAFFFDFFNLINVAFELITSTGRTKPF